MVIETGLSDFHKMCITVMKMYYNKQKALRESFNVTLEKYAPSKARYTRTNQAPYTNKKLSKEIMKRSRLRNKFLNTKSDLDRRTYNKQRNYVVSLMRRGKK